MRITRDTLLKLAQETVAQRTRSNRGIISAYAAGSLLLADPLLGGTTDIDLFFIHDNEPAQAREIVRLSPDVHLDIAHHNQALYRQPRHLRLDPWLGFTLYDNPILLHDTQHWFEFTQASVRSQFWQAGNVVGRVRPLAEKARQTWIELQNAEDGAEGSISHYLDAIEQAANAIACLTGSPLSERRFLVQYAERTENVHIPGLAAGLQGLLGTHLVEVDRVKEWLPLWKADFQAAGDQPDAPAHLHPTRLAYYERAILTFLNSDHPQYAIWPLLSTWNRAVESLPGEQVGWSAACAALGLDAAAFADRLAGLDAYLDNVEESLEIWARENGA